METQPPCTEDICTEFNELRSEMVLLYELKNALTNRYLGGEDDEDDGNVGEDDDGNVGEDEDDGIDVDGSVGEVTRMMNCWQW